MPDFMDGFSVPNDADDQNVHVKIQYRKKNPKDGVQIKTYEYKNGKSEVHHFTPLGNNRRRKRPRKKEEDETEEYIIATDLQRINLLIKLLLIFFVIQQGQRRRGLP